MFLKLILLFTLVPILELALLIKIGGYIGIISTIILVALTGILGVTLARNQGYLVINKIKNSLSQGKMPASDLIEGLLILIGGVLLLTPGILTDITGFTLIIPHSRKIIARLVRKRFQIYLRRQNINYSREYVDIEPEDRDER